VLDRGGVFKARKPRHETKDAEEVKETADTKRDVPVDMQDAMTVEVHVGPIACCPVDVNSRDGIML